VIGCDCWNLQQESAKVIFLAGVSDWLSGQGIFLPKTVNCSCESDLSRPQTTVDGFSCCTELVQIAAMNGRARLGSRYPYRGGAGFLGGWPCR
jgi:hypothetical protein